MTNGATTERIASNVRAEMARRNQTQTSLAAQIDRPQSFLSRRLAGHIPFNVAELDQIAKALGCSLTDLIGEERASA